MDSPRNRADRRIRLAKSYVLIVVFVFAAYVTLYLISIIVMMAGEDQSYSNNAMEFWVDAAHVMHKYVLGFPIGVFFWHRDDYYMHGFYIIVLNCVLVSAALIIRKTVKYEF